MKLVLLSLLFIVFSYANAHNVLPGWGRDGHQITAGIAQQLITSDVASKVNNVLNGQTMVDVAAWADQIKHEAGWQWSGELHFINTPDWACNYEPSRDCPDSKCVQGAIANYTRRSQSESGDAQNVALKFLIHFVGDIHQPLHVGFGSDRGGNDIHGTFNGYDDNLHAIWDSWVIDERMKDNFGGSQGQYTDYLVKQVQGPWASNATQWANCDQDQCATEWATVSADLACEYAYTDSKGNHIKNGFDLGTPYYDYVKGIIDEQLAKGGVRLAMVLNKIYGNGRPLPSNL